MITSDCSSLAKTELSSGKHGDGMGARVQRYPEFDVAKGIGIMCVVLGHILDAGMAKSFVYLFHMPLFFIISGHECPAVSCFMPIV